MSSFFFTKLFFRIFSFFLRTNEITRRNDFTLEDAQTSVSALLVPPNNRRGDPTSSSTLVHPHEERKSRSLFGQELFFIFMAFLRKSTEAERLFGGTYFQPCHRRPLCAELDAPCVSLGDQQQQQTRSMASSSFASSGNDFDSPL